MLEGRRDGLVSKCSAASFSGRSQERASTFRDSCRNNQSYNGESSSQNPNPRTRKSRHRGTCFCPILSLRLRICRVDVERMG